MTAHPRRLSPSATIADALLALVEGSSPSAQVLDASGTRVGLVTPGDLLRATLAPGPNGQPCWTPELIPVSTFMAPCPPPEIPDPSRDALEARLDEIGSQSFPASDPPA